MTLTLEEIVLNFHPVPTNLLCRLPEGNRALLDMSHHLKNVNLRRILHTPPLKIAENSPVAVIPTKLVRHRFCPMISDRKQLPVETHPIHRQYLSLFLVSTRLENSRRAAKLMERSPKL